MTDYDLPSDVDFISARMRMVDTQLSPRGITDAAVLAAMRTVPRHQFVPDKSIGEAYGDHPVPIGFGQTISQPYIVASMTQEVQIDHKSKVLEVGTGCGYQTAVLAEIAGRVLSIEFVPQLLKEANDRLQQLGYLNITTMLGDGALGWPQQAPFDAIVVTAAAPSIPPALIEQLVVGGRMVIPVASGGSFNQELILVTKTAEGFTQNTLYGVRFVLLQGSGSTGANDSF